LFEVDIKAVLTLRLCPTDHIHNTCTNLRTAIIKIVVCTSNIKVTGLHFNNMTMRD